MEREFIGVVEAVWTLSDRVKNIRFSVPEGFTFLPGQYVFADLTIEGRRLLRAYSIASSPHLRGSIDLCVTLVEGGPASTFLHAMKVGDKIGFRGPVGTFTLNQTTDPILFFATGSGIAPFRSMINFALSQGWKNEIHLVFGVRTDKDILYREEWAELEKVYPQFHALFTYSRQEGVETGYVQTKVDRFKDLKDAHVYICGLGKMVLETQEAVRDAGFKQIFLERYD